jgi:5,10-methylenetetrahydromethanopterin reductase
VTTLAKRKFGISIEPTWPIRYSSELAILAERNGFSNVWVPDGGPSPPYSDPIVTLAAVAAVTSRIKFGSAILNFYTRNPASIASSFLAMSDLGSKGNRTRVQRTVLGLGVGSDYNVAKFGIRNRTGVIIELREAIESISELFEGKEVTVRTDAYTIEAVSLSKPRRKIPIYVGSSSPKGLELAGEISDGAILTDRIPDDIEESVNHIILGLGYSSRSRKDIEIVNSVVVSIDDDRGRARHAVKSTCAYLVSWMSDQKAEAHQIDLALKGQITKFIESGDEGSAAKLVDNKMVDLLTASGNTQDCLEKCREYYEHDIDQLAFCEPFGPRPKDSIVKIAKKVISKL